jgi:putative phosphoribosyl transferase
MLFENRAEAGKQLAALLQDLRGPDTIVLAVPRGGVVVGYAVACALGAPLDVYIARKLSAPGNEELAIGAVASDGTLVLDPTLTRQLGVSQRYIQSEIERQRAEILRRLSLYRYQGSLPRLQGKTILLVDDGVATGSTTLVSLRALRKQQPALLALAVPVGPADVIERLKVEADRVVCLATPEPFWAVGSFFADWQQLDDQDVSDLLNQRRREMERDSASS